MMKHGYWASLLLLVSVWSFADQLSMTLPQRPANADQAVLVLDTASTASGIANLRSSGQVEKLTAGIDQTGLAELKMYGSAQFTPAALATFRAKIAGPLTVFDLRQEAHGFIQGAAVTWYASNDWGQVGLSHEQAIAQEARKLGLLSQQASVSLLDGKAVKLEQEDAEPHLLQAQEVFSEQQVVIQNAAQYVRLTVTDHVRPSDEEVERFIRATQSLPAGGSVYFHCRAGQGRTTTFMVLYDMLRNARRVSMEDILRRQAMLGRDYDVDKLPAEDDWKYVYQKDRAAFVQAFYAYARANPDGKPLGWLAWRKKNT